MKTLLGLKEEDKALGFFMCGMSDRAELYRGTRRPIADKVEWREDAKP